TVVDTFYGQLIEQLVAATHKMIFIVRCYIPVDTIRRLLVVAPRNAEYERGFQIWVERIANLASQLGCRVVFLAYRTTIDYIRIIVSEQAYEIRAEMMPMDTWEDFILYSPNIDNDDLLMVVNARRGSPSWSGDLDALPSFLSRHFKNQNLVLIYPEQFGGHASAQ
ncbi:MAG: cation:proton antiporter, partial [Muribaculaceae bacterium]|nr:cation:proton antiporter [Muribaculaceae bacterium]